MNTAHPHSIQRSMQQALTGPQPLVDGRTETDGLHFIAQFARLINFYDQDNQPNGNWEPFVLKDPVFLLSTISKASLKAFENAWHYAMTSLPLQQLKERLRLLPRPPLAAPPVTVPLQDPELPPAVTTGTAGENLNQLFDVLNWVFLYVRRWVYYMQVSGENYALKTYVLEQVKSVFSPGFWALTNLRQRLVRLNYRPGIRPVPESDRQLFQQMDRLINPVNNGLQATAHLAGIAEPLMQNSPMQIAQALSQVQQQLFQFIYTVKAHAPEALQLVAATKSRLPDTLLLRTFMHLLQAQRRQINAITGKHLQYCYRNVLGLNPQPGVPDEVYVCAEPSKKDAVFLLPAGTLLNAGLDADKQQISFATTAAQSINPATITSAITLAAVTGTDGRQRLYRQDIAAPGTVQRNEAGAVQGWPSFGGGTAPPTMQQGQSIAFASPLLLLREGDRRITMTLSFEVPTNAAALDDVQYSLSTQHNWLPVTGTVLHTVTDGNLLSGLTVLLQLDAAQPPIEPLLKSPEPLASPWPQVKIDFLSFSSLATPPRLTKLTIEVTVRGITTVQLYNDFGALNPAAPFQLFGPSPLINSNFMVGSNEVFSKPLTALQVQFNWDKLPANFADYYKTYNAYLNALNQPPKKKQGLPVKIITAAGNAVKKALHWVTHIFKRHEDEKPAVACPSFCNTAFTVGFEQLQGKQWLPLDMWCAKTMDAGSGTLGWQPYVADTGCGCTAPATENLLFATDGEHCTTTPVSYFVYDKAVDSQHPFTANPQLQLNPLTYTAGSNSGFIKFSLTGPEYGFGSELYPPLVSAIAMQNAWALFNSKSGDDFFNCGDASQKPVFGQAPLPFAPKLTGVQANYSASVEYGFSNADAYPLQCFAYSPFATCKIYDNTAAAPGPAFITDITGPLQPGAGNGIPLYQSVSNEGTLFIEMDQVIPANPLSIYAELAPQYQAGTTAAIPEYYYLGANGWATLPVLSGKAARYTCSGTIEVQLPSGITKGSPLMPGDKYWLALTMATGTATAPQTLLLKTNGLLAVRTGDAVYTSTAAPTLAAGVISKPLTAVPQIAALVQPFPSFGGKAAETDEALYTRAANRLYTKDRALTASDYYRLMAQQFPEVFASRVLASCNTVQLRVVKACASSRQADAYRPMLSTCATGSMQEYLVQRIPAGTAVTVMNFNLQCVQVQANVLVQPGYEVSGVQKNIISQVNNWLSPWISGSPGPDQLHTVITGTQAAAFISTIDGVAEVNSIALSTWKYEDEVNGLPPDTTAVDQVTLFDAAFLLVPALDQLINCNAPA